MREKTIIRKAASADVNRLVTHLVRAFDKDPVINWIVRQDNKRAYGFDALFRASLSKRSLPHGEVLTTDDCLGSALWVPPEKTKISFPQQLLMLPAMICACRLRGLMRLKNVLHNIEKAHPTKKHYYLQFIGVDPDHRRKGLGSALIKPVLNKCDREGCGAYLETSNKNNLSFYGQLGFKVIGKDVLGQDAPPLWNMWRRRSC